MAVVAEFISVLRKIRDVIYPQVNALYEDSLVLKETIDVGKAEFDEDFAQFVIDYATFNTKKDEVDDALVSAQGSASQASASALIATNKSNEIKGITAQSITGAAGTSASASYNPTDGKFTFVIPQGSKGDKGESFTVNSSGITEQRALYDNQIAGWSFLDITTSTLYFKLSNASGDWSTGVPFGKGDKGDDGDTGVGIVSFTFISTTDSSGLPAQSGATDTYRVTLTNTNTFDYQVYNGLDASLDYINEQIDIVQENINTVSTQVTEHVPLSGITSYHLLQGNLAVSNSTITQGFNTTLYTGNGSTQSINTGIDMATQWGDSPDEKFGGLVWLKSRSAATNNFLFDTIRGIEKEINTNTTEAEATLASSLTAFNTTGFSLGSAAGINVNLATYYAGNFQTTHRITGTTNHGKAYTCHYNPYTGFTIVKYEGSGIVGHEIPHHLGRKLSFLAVKNLSAAWDWAVQGSFTGSKQVLNLNTTGALTNATNEYFKEFTDTVSIIGTDNNYANASTNQYIVYGWANSYFDESDKLIGNYELVTYQGTGVAGNKVKTKGKPAWIMIKRVDSTGDWFTFDNQRETDILKDHYLHANTNIAESVSATFGVNFLIDGFTCNDSNVGNNASGGQYIALVAYDTNSNGGGSYYPLASDTANVQINNALIPLAQGIDSNGVKNTILSKNETITGLTYTQGKNYVYCDKNGSYGVTPYKPRYLESELVRTFASEAPEYYDVGKNKWFNTSGQGELITNGTFNSNTTGWTGVNGIIANPSGTLQFTANLSVLAYVYTSISTTVGNTYTLKVTTNSMTDSQVWLYVGSSYNSGDAYLHNGVTSPWTLGVKEVVFTAVSTTTYICFRTDNGRVINLDSISTFIKDITPTTEIAEARNYMNHIVHADNDGGVLYVEELPKIEYKDIVKANELKGKNACTAWVNFDGTTTPPTIRDSYNVSAVIRTGTGLLDVYFEDEMDTNTYCPVFGNTSTTGGDQVVIYGMTTKKLSIATRDEGSVAHNLDTVIIHIMGGKN